MAPLFNRLLIPPFLPFSRSLDNAYTNKTLCYHEENRDIKKNQMPYEAYLGNAEKWREILARVRWQRLVF